MNAFRGRAGEWLLLVVLAAAWGTSFVLMKMLDDAGIPTLTTVAARVAIGALVLLVVVRANGARLPTTRVAWSAFTVEGVLNNVVPFALIVYGETRIASGLAAILNATTPIFALLVAVLVRQEPLRPHRVAGMLLGFAGVAVVVGPAALRTFDLANVAQLAVLVAALSYGAAAVYARRFARLGIAPLEVATGQLVASAAIAVPLALAVDRPWQLAPPAPATWFALLTLAVVCTGLAYVVYFRLIATLGAVNASLVTMLTPVSALLVGFAVLGERLRVTSLIGMLVIVAALALLDGRILQVVRPRRAQGRAAGEYTGRT